jgi:hypothetical protein
MKGLLVESEIARCELLGPNVHRLMAAIEHKIVHETSRACHMISTTAWRS